ncbi:hypothetical protein D0Y65_021338, partial [Glycine soja]
QNVLVTRNKMIHEMVGVKIIEVHDKYLGLPTNRVKGEKFQISLNCFLLLASFLVLLPLLSSLRHLDSTSVKVICDACLLFRFSVISFALA